MNYINEIRRVYLSEVASIMCSRKEHKKGNNIYEIKKNACNEIVLEFLEIKGDDLVLEGYYIVLADSTADKTYVKLTLNEKTVVGCKAINGRNDDAITGKNKNLLVVPFEGIVPNVSAYDSISIKIELVNGTKNLCETAIRSDKFFPFCLDFQNAYAVVKNWLIRIDNNILVMKPATSKDIFEAEHRLCEEYISLNDDDATKSVYYRYFYHCYKTANNREIWLISDQWHRADDNGEALFSYIEKNKMAIQDVYFVLDRNSTDYERVSQYGRVIEPNSFEHRLYRLLADKICLSHADDIFADRYFHNQTRYYQDILCRGKYIFLQHGITQNNVSNYLNRYRCNISLLTAGGIKEQDGFTCGQYFYDNSVVKMTGLARYDNLRDNRSKVIIIMPTWRANLASCKTHHINGAADVTDDFDTSDFFLFYNTLLNDAELIGHVKKYGYKIKFMPHPNVRPFLERFQLNDMVEFCDSDTRYRDLFAEGSLLITDYSSVAFDFAYLNKPVIYCQFDREYFFSGHYKAGYFNYAKDGFGEVTYDVSSTIKCIKEYITNNCSLKNKYRKRIREFFRYNDKNNCKRIYEAVLNLQSAHKFYRGDNNWSEEIFNSIIDIPKQTMSSPPLHILSYKYMFPCHLFCHTDKVVIYGAGKVGLEFYYQNKMAKFLDIVSVIDKKYDTINVEGLIVEDIKSLSTKNYDYILIAVLSGKVAESIMEELIGYGIARDKIKWDGIRYSWLNFYAGGGFDALIEEM